MMTSRRPPQFLFGDRSSGANVPSLTRGPLSVFRFLLLRNDAVSFDLERRSSLFFPFYFSINFSSMNKYF